MRDLLYRLSEIDYEYFRQKQNIQKSGHLHPLVRVLPVGVREFFS
jgi:hypothetical protein